MFYDANSNNQGAYQEQSQSSCSQCHRNTFQNQPHQQNSNSSSDSQRQVIQPLRKNIIDKNYEFEKTLQLLRKDIENLKRQNQVKDKMISQLQYRAQITQRQEIYRSQIERKNIQMNRLSKQIGFSPRNNYQHDNYNRSYTNNTDQIQNSMKRQKASLYLDRQVSPKGQNMKYFASNSFGHDIKSPGHQNNQANNSLNNELKLKIMQTQIRQYQLELLQLKQYISVLQEGSQWQIKFISSFIKMSQQLSLNYGQKLIVSFQKNNMKQITKNCWSYMKDLISFFVTKYEQSKRLNY